MLLERIVANVTVYWKAETSIHNFSTELCAALEPVQDPGAIPFPGGTRRVPRARSVGRAKRAI